jgi:hypothetical protein
MTVETFFTKNLKWITIGLLFLFMIKGIQSCNRGITIKKQDKIYMHDVDSLKTTIIKKDSIIQHQQYQINLADEKVKSADKRADDVKEVASKVKSNTTIKVVTSEQNKPNN